jgi:hypothetical protein
MIWFLVAARYGDMLSINGQDIVRQGEDALWITFRASKEAKLRGIASELVVHIPQAWREQTFWFPPGPAFTARLLNDVIEALGPEATRHSIRRSAIQEVAKVCTTWEQIMVFARHQSLDVSKRYLAGLGFSPDTLLNRATTAAVWK